MINEPPEDVDDRRNTKSGGRHLPPPATPGTGTTRSVPPGIVAPNVRVVSTREVHEVHQEQSGWRAPEARFTHYTNAADLAISGTLGDHSVRSLFPVNTLVL